MRSLDAVQMRVGPVAGLDLEEGVLVHVCLNGSYIDTVALQ